MTERSKIFAARRERTVNTTAETKVRREKKAIGLHITKKTKTGRVNNVKKKSK